MSKLKDQGFSPQQIDRAMKVALKRKVTEPSGPPIPRHPPERKLPEPPRTPTMEIPTPGAPKTGIREPLAPVPRHPTPRGTPPERISGAPMPTRGPMPPTPPSTSFTYEQPEEFTLPSAPEITLEEVVEGIVADKWDEFEHRLSNFEKRDIQLQNQLEDMRKKLDEIDKKTREKEETLGGKFDDFGESMTNIEGRIGSMEKVFKDFVPQLTRNIKTMSEIIEKTK